MYNYKAVTTAFFEDLPILSSSFSADGSEVCHFIYTLYNYIYTLYNYIYTLHISRLSYKAVTTVFVEDLPTLSLSADGSEVHHFMYTLYNYMYTLHVHTL